MGNLYNAKLKIDKIINDRRLDPFEIRGEIGLKAGLILAFLGPDTPDDNVLLERLKKAVEEVLNETI